MRLRTGKRWARLANFNPDCLTGGEASEARIVFAENLASVGPGGSRCSVHPEKSQQQGIGQAELQGELYNDDDPGHNDCVAGEEDELEADQAAGGV